MLRWIFKLYEVEDIYDVIYSYIEIYFPSFRKYFQKFCSVCVQIVYR